MSTQSVKIVAIVVSYNNSHDELSCLVNSLEVTFERYNKNDMFSFSIILVENDAKAREFTPRKLNSKTKFISLPFRGNLGFGGGVNYAVESIVDDEENTILVVCNPDGLCHPNMFSELLPSVLSNPLCVVEARQFPSEHPKPYEPETGVTPWITGCCFALYLHSFKLIGGFDERIFLYMEDVDFSLRARLRGLQLKIASKALFYHCDLNRDSTGSRKYALQSTYQLARKWGATQLEEEMYNILEGEKSLPEAIVFEGVDRSNNAEFEELFKYVHRCIRWI